MNSHYVYVFQQHPPLQNWERQQICEVYVQLSSRPNLKSGVPLNGRVAAAKPFENCVKSSKNYYWSCIPTTHPSEGVCAGSNDSLYDCGPNGTTDTP